MPVNPEGPPPVYELIAHPPGGMVVASAREN